MIKFTLHVLGIFCFRFSYKFLWDSQIRNEKDKKKYPADPQQTAVLLEELLPLLPKE
jgi:hypothetical protein